MDFDEDVATAPLEPRQPQEASTAMEQLGDDSGPDEMGSALKELYTLYGKIQD